MEQDDRQHGRLLSRRQAVALFGASAAAAVAATHVAGQAAPPAIAPNCIAIPQQTEGPYFVDERLLRSDVRHDPSNGSVVAGAPLELTLHVSTLGTGGACAPLAGALVDIWQCDAMGVYSDARDRSFDTRGQKFLRGYQVSDANGLVRFTTIYPGWYPGRAVHVHFKIRPPQGASGGSEFVSQFYFDEALTDRVHAREPYAAHKGRRLLNERDFIYRDGGGQLILPVTTAAQGFAAEFSVAMSGSQRRGRG